MATVLEVLETTAGVSGGAALGQGSKFTRTFLVTFSGINKSPAAACLANDGINAVPDYGTVHADDYKVYVIDKEAKPADGGGGIYWEVTVQYGRPTIAANPSASPAAPPDNTAGSGSPPAPQVSTKIQWGVWTRTVSPLKDLNGNVFRNSAQDLIDPPPTREEENIQITYTRTQAGFSVQWLRNLNNRININSITIGGYTFLPGTLKAKITADFPAGNSSTAWQVTIVLQHDPDGWDWSLLDAGYKYLSGGNTREFRDNNLPATKPHLLDGSGGALGAGGTPVFLSFRKYWYADFAYLALDY